MVYPKRLQGSRIIVSPEKNREQPGTRNRPDRVVLAGVAIDSVTLDQALDRIEELIREPGPSQVVTPNVDHVCQYQKGVHYREVYDAADLVLADGMPLIWASRWLGRPLPERVTGADLFPALCQRASERGYGVFFLGGLPGVAEKASKVLVDRFPRLQVKGTYSPPFGFENDPKEMSHILEMIVSVSPHILFVGLGSPKQEFFIYDHRNILNVPVSIGVGASFDFVAGTMKRAPRFMQRLGLEWLYRLMQEPRRLFYRYLIRDAAFFRLVLRQKLQR